MKENSSYYDAAMQKRIKLEKEISKSNATEGEKRDMQHTLSKMWMFSSDVIDELDRHAERANKVYQLKGLQEELGYVSGPISTVAVLGLVGEAGEVLGETFVLRSDISTWDVLKGALAGCEKADELKKEIRKNQQFTTLILKQEKEPLFDAELADAFYYVLILATNRSLTIFDLAEMAYNKVRAKQAAGGSSEDKKV